MALENLSVRIGSQTADVRTGLNAVKRSLSAVGREALETASETSVASGGIDELGDDAAVSATQLAVLANRTDEAGDEMVDIVPRAATASGAISSVGSSSAVASGGVTSLSGSITTALIPALAVLSTTLFPIAAILGTAAAAVAGLAGAFGLILGSGAVAGFDSLKTSFRTTMQAVETLVAGFGKQFVPLIRDAIHALPDLTRNILDAVGSMEPFVDFLRDMGGLAMDAIPGLVGTLVDLGRQALPAVRDLITYLVQNGPSIFREMVSTTRELAPQIMDFVDAVIEATPALLEFGTFVFATVVPALSQFIDRVTPLVRGVTDLVQFFGSLNSQLKETAPLFHDSMVTGVNALIDPIGAVTDAVDGLDEAWGAMTDGILSDMKPFVRDLTSAFNGLIELINSVIRQANKNLPGFQMNTFEMLSVPEFAQEPSGSFGATGSTMPTGSQTVDVNVNVETDDEGMGEWVRAQAETEVRENQRSQTDKAFARRNFSR